MVAINLDGHVTHHGPIFDHRAEAAVADFLDDAKDAVARQAFANVMTNLNASIRQPTPYYETQIITERQANDRVVHDRGIVYGPWLEGTGSRNRTTRFKGYASFRRAAQQTQGEVPRLVAFSLRRALERLR